MSANRSHRPNRHVTLWVVQSVLAALFLFAGVMKLAAPSAELAKMSTLSPEFLKFIGACEVLGALGLVLPGLLRVRIGLTPLAAVGLVVIMIGAVVTTVATYGAAAAATPLVVGVLAAIVAVRRARWNSTAALAA
jgi:uncharacterized membrane protein YphA (DoxX/SURF4 family)